MLFLIILAITQTMFLPGYIVLRALRLNDGFLKSFHQSMAVSLTINCIAAFIFCALHIYSTPAVYVYFGACVALLAGILYFDRNYERGGGTGSDLSRFVDLGRAISAEPSALKRTISVMAIASALLTVVLYLIRSYNEIGTTFSVHDAVLSWDRWAEDYWAAGEPALLTAGYPQLIPANWSLVYLMLANPTIKLVAKWIMSLFPIGILLIQMDLGLRLKKPSYFFAVGLTGLAMYLMMDDFLTAGYVDVPVGFMAMACFYPILFGRVVDDPVSFRRQLLLGAFIGFGCMMTKQAGYSVVAVYPLIAYFCMKDSSIDSRQLRRVAIYAAVLIAVLFAGQFVYKWFANRLIEGTNVAYIMFDKDLHAQRSYWQRLVHSIQMMNGYFSWPVFSVVTPVCLLLAMYRRLWRWLLPLVVIPSFLFWAFFISYSQRNIFLAVPFAVCAVVAGLEVAVSFVSQRRHGRQALVAVCGLGAFAGLYAANARFFAAKDLLSLQTKQSTAVVGSAQHNHVLYSCLQADAMKGRILSNYYFMRALPEVNKMYVEDTFTESPEIFEQRIRDRKINYVFFVKYMGVEPALDRHFTGEIARNRFKVLKSVSREIAGYEAVLVQVMDAPK